MGRLALLVLGILCVLMKDVEGSIDVLFVGTGAGGSSKLRGSTSIALRLHDGEVWMFDCGEGTSLKMNEVFLKPSKIGAIFITHLHGDHVWGLTGVICSHWNSNDTVQRRGKFGFHVFGPRGIRKLLRQQLLLSRSMCMFHYTVHELIPMESQYDNKDEHDYYKVIETADGPLHPQEILGQDIEAHIGPDGNPMWNLVNDTRGTVVAGMISHRLPTFGYTYKETCQIANINTALLRAKYNLTPGVEYGLLQKGYSVQLPNNITIHPEEVQMKKAEGRKITILGDTSNPWPMLGISKGSDVLIHEATHFKHQREAAEFYGHSTPTMAIRFAKAAHCQVVVLTHISQRVVSRYGYPGKHWNKTVFTTDDIMNEAVDELMKYRHKNLSILIAEDGSVLRLEKKTHLSNRTQIYLTRLKKGGTVSKTVFESIPTFYSRPPYNYNAKFKSQAFFPPLRMLSNFSRHKFLKYYNSSDLSGTGLQYMPLGNERVNVVRKNGVNGTRYVPSKQNGVNGARNVPPGQNGVNGARYVPPPGQNGVNGARYVRLETEATWTRRSFCKSIQENKGNSLNSSFLSISDNRTFINLEPEYLQLRASRSKDHYERKYSNYQYNKNGVSETTEGVYDVSETTERVNGVSEITEGVNGVSETTEGVEIMTVVI